MATVRFELEGQGLPATELPSHDQKTVREAALLCRESGLPFRLRYPLSRPFRYPLAASFTSR